MSADSFFSSTKVGLIAGLARYVLRRPMNGNACGMNIEEIIGM